MCNPLLIAAGATMAVQGAGAIQSSNAADTQGKSQQSYYDYVAKQNKIQADAALKLGDEQSKQAQDVGALDALAATKKAAAFKASQIATEASNGINSGVTRENIALDTMEKADLDQQMIRYNADSRSYAAKTGASYQAYDLNNQSKLNTIAGQNAKTAGKINSQTSLLQGASSIAGSAFNYALYTNPAKLK